MPPWERWEEISIQNLLLTKRGRGNLDPSEILSNNNSIFQLELDSMTITNTKPEGKVVWPTEISDRLPLGINAKTRPGKKATDNTPS